MPWIMHIDMDAFFASVEQLDDATLRGKPVVVGGGTRGVVSAASYEARAFGVHSAMPVGQARRLCPQAIFVPGRMQRYAELSRVVMETLGQFSPLVEPASIDEAYMDAGGLERLFGPVETMATLVREAVRETTGGLSCSVGVAPIKFLAKIASDVNKPGGQYILHPEQVPAFLEQLPVHRIPGVGKRFVEALRLLGVRHVGQVLRFPPQFWERRFGKAGVQLYARAQGQDERCVEVQGQCKSESAENTFAKDTWDREYLRRCLLAHAERVGTSLRRQGLSGRTITLKLKYADFSQLTRSLTLPRSTNSTQSIFETACHLLEQVDLAQKVRLIGLGVSGFAPRAEQCLLPLLVPPEKDEERRRKLDTALDTLRQRFGKKAVIRGRLFP